MNEKPTNEKENDDPNVNQRDDLLSAAKLKKKELQSKNLKRKKT
jgi:zinc finger SWIM domain-containing protein 3